VLATFQAIESTGKDALVELRRLLGILRMDTPDLAIGPQPGVQSLGELAAQVEAAGLPVEVTVAGEPTVLPSGLDMTAYRIVQEALTNALRHAREATRAEVAVRYCASSVEIEITDDGSGSVTNGVSPGHGLIGMRERVGLYGGTLALEQPEAGGFRVRAVLPVASART
jgi:signal transduction histidine kinase